MSDSYMWAMLVRLHFSLTTAAACMLPQYEDVVMAHVCEQRPLTRAPAARCRRRRGCGTRRRPGWSAWAR